MEPLILFRTQAEGLSPKELQWFYTIFSMACGQRIFLSALFCLFNAQRQNNDFERVHQAIRLIAAIKNARDQDNNLEHPMEQPLDTVFIDNIVNSRNEPPHQSLEQSLNASSSPCTTVQPRRKPLSLDEIPSVLIGEIGSYLQFDSYHSLMKCARSIYLGCNTPNTLRSIHKRALLRNAFVNKEHLQRQHLKLTNFGKLTHLGLDVNAFMEMEVLHQTPLSRSTTSLSLYNSNQITMRRFLSTTALNFGQITKLKIMKYTVKWGNAQVSVTETYCEVWCLILQTFSNIRYLELMGMDIYELSVCT